VGECFFWYRPTRVVPDQRPLNGRRCRCCFYAKNVMQDITSLTIVFAEEDRFVIKFLRQNKYYSAGHNEWLFDANMALSRPVGRRGCVGYVNKK